MVDRSGDFQHALLLPDGHGLSGWTSVGLPSVTGTPLLLARQIGGIDRVSVLSLSNNGVLSLDRYSFKEWDSASGTWSASMQLAFLGEPVLGGLDASVRPDGTMDLAGMFGEGRIVYNWFDGTSPGPWKEMGPLPNGRRSVKPPTVSSGYFGGPLDTSGVVLADFMATDQNGTIWLKEGRISPATWVPSNYNWISVGGSNFGRVSAARNSRGEMDLVVRDFDRKTVRFKRLRNVGGSANKIWSPSQDLWFDLGGQGASDPVVVERSGAPDVVDVFSVDANGDMWHRAFVVPPYVSDPWKQQYDIDYATYCCAQSPANPACPCIPQ
jgi:hypothetical protein